MTWPCASKISMISSVALPSLDIMSRATCDEDPVVIIMKLCIVRVTCWLLGYTLARLSRRHATGLESWMAPYWSS